MWQKLGMDCVGIIDIQKDTLSGYFSLVDLLLFGEEIHGVLFLSEYVTVETI